MKQTTKAVAMIETTPTTEPQPSTKFRKTVTGGSLLRRITFLSVTGLMIGLIAQAPLRAADPSSSKGAKQWCLPNAHDVQLGGTLGEAYRRGVDRLAEDPYQIAYLRADVSFEMKRFSTNYSGDVSGRFLEIASLTSPCGKMAPDVLVELLKTITDYQKADGHYGCDIDWNTPLNGKKEQIKTPTLWGNARLLVGLLEAHQTYDLPKLLESARRLGDFYVATADRFLDPAREAEYRATGTYANSYVTDYFPAIEGLVRLY
jgi:hypothetical protein